MPGSDMASLYRQIWDNVARREDAWDVFTRMLSLIHPLRTSARSIRYETYLIAAGVITSTRVRHPTATLNREALGELAVVRDRLG